MTVFTKFSVIFVQNKNKKYEHKLERSNCLNTFYKKVFLKVSQNFTAKHNAVLEPKGCNFIKKQATKMVLSCEICEIFKNTFFIEFLWETASESKN